MASPAPIGFNITAPGHISPFGGENGLRKGAYLFSCAIDLHAKLNFQEHAKDRFELVIENYKHTVTYTYDDLHSLLSVKPTLNENANVSTFNWETPELLDLMKYMPHVIKFVGTLQNVKLQDVYHEFVLYDFFLLVAGILCSVDLKIEPFSVFIKSDIPGFCNMGTSAAYSCCIAAALVHYIRLKTLKANRISSNISKPVFMVSKINPFNMHTFDTLEKDIIFRWSCLGEKLLPREIYGIGSSISVYGQALEFNTGTSEFRPSIIQFTRVGAIDVLIVQSGVKCDRNSLQKKIAYQAQTMPAVVEALLRFEQAVSEVFVALYAASSAKRGMDIGELLEIDHYILVGLEMSHPHIDNIWTLVKQYNFHGKMFGPGVGGCVLVPLLKPVKKNSLKALKAALHEKGYKFIESKLGVSGLEINNNDSVKAL